MQTAQITAGRMMLDVNCVVRHLDANGKAKSIFQENSFAIRLIKAGILSPAWINTSFGKTVSYTGILGFWATEKNSRNLVVTIGKESAARLLSGVGGIAVMQSVGQGTGVSAAAAGDTTLGTEVKADGTAAAGVHAIAAATTSVVTTTTTNDTAQFVGTVSETATIAVTESGIFNATTNGNMLARQTFTAVNVVSGDSLQFTWKIKFA